MSLTKYERFRDLLAKEGLSTPAEADGGITRREGPREAEASFAQRRIWIHQTRDPASRVYNILLALRISGHLSPAAMTQTLQAIVDRHEALRTSFKTIGGQPHQVVAAACQPAVRVIDLGGLATPAVVLPAVLRDLQRTPLPLHQPPLVAFTLVRESPVSHVLAIVLHHIIFDFVSSQVLFDELRGIYARVIAGGPIDLEPLDIHYLDYSRWQRSRFDAVDRDERLRAWRQSIGAEDDLPLLELPNDRAPHGDGEFVPALARFTLPASMASRVARLATGAGVSPFVVWLTAFQLLLHRYTQADDVLLCVTNSERDEPALERAIGFFINQMPVKLAVRREATFRTLVRAVRDDYLAALDVRRFPFDQLVEALSRARIRRATELAAIGFDYQRVTRGRWEIAGLRAEFLESDVPIAKAEVALSVYEEPDRCRGFLEYNGARFSAELMAGMAREYGRLLDQLLEAPDRPIGNVLSQATEHDEADGTTAVRGEVASRAVRLQERFEQQVAAVPDAMALAGAEGQVTYRGLDRRANQVARALRAAGVRPHEAVGLLAPRGVDMYVGVLGILKCGAVYVPIDPAHPASYVRDMIRGARIAHVLAAAGLSSMPAAASGTCARLIDMRALFDASLQESSAPLAVSEGGCEAAYICFTSGSTGSAKGVFVGHGAAAVHLDSFLRSVPHRRGDRVLQFAASIFDVSLEQMFSVWSVGATLVARGEEIWSVRELCDTAAREQLTSINLPTAYWNQMVRVCATTGAALNLPALREMIAGGEAMLTSTARQWRALAGPNPRLLNAYGPTEAVITASVHDVDRDGALHDDRVSVPIGRGLDGRIVAVLDRHGIPVPSGAVGELCLGGPALAHGYVNTARQTAASFWPASGEMRAAGEAVLPEGGTATGARMYRTGDLVRRRADGTIEYVRRIDEEVKIRGVRVRPGEIEATVLQHDDILEAAVVVHERRPAAAETIDVDDVETYRPLLSRLTPQAIEHALRDIETQVERAAAEGGGARIEQRTPQFHLALDVLDHQFLAAPRAAQRNWMITRALDECADDLRVLDAHVKRFVPGSARVEIRGDLAQARPDVHDTGLIIADQQVMQAWQRPLMRALAEAVTHDHGRVLEIGFGMGISAGFVQTLGARSHTIVEANPHVAQAARDWRARHPAADIAIVEGRWEDVADALGQFDGILFDTYPLTEAEFRTRVLGGVTFAEHSFAFAARHLRAGGAFTYYTNEIDSLSRRHQRALLRVFQRIEIAVVRDLQPPADAQNWWADSMAVVRARTA